MKELPPILNVSNAKGCGRLKVRNGIELQQMNVRSAIENQIVSCCGARQGAIVIGNLVMKDASPIFVKGATITSKIMR